LRVHIEVVEVIGCIVRGRLLRCADRVGVYAPVAHSVGVCLQICHLLLTAWEVAIDAGTASPVVGLVCDVASVAEDDDGGDWKKSEMLAGLYTTVLTLVARARFRIQGRRVWLHAAVERDTSASTENVASDLSTLGVASKNDLGVRALLSIRGHLLVSRHRAVVSRLAGEIRVERRVVEIFVAAACQTIARGFHEHALASRIRLVIPSCQEEMHFVADLARIIILLGPHDGCPAKRQQCQKRESRRKHAWRVTGMKSKRRR
jgi:hypothetical protein